MRCKPSHNVVARVTSDTVSAAHLVTNSLAIPLGYMDGLLTLSTLNRRKIWLNQQNLSVYFGKTEIMQQYLVHIASYSCVKCVRSI